MATPWNNSTQTNHTSHQDDRSGILYCGYEAVRPFVGLSEIGPGERRLQLVAKLNDGGGKGAGGPIGRGQWFDIENFVYIRYIVQYMQYCSKYLHWQYSHRIIVVYFR